MEELDGFNSLDPLGPEYGKINQPLIDEKGFSAFEGDKIEMPKADLSEPSFYYPSIPGIGNLNRPNRPIVNNHVKTNAVNPSIPQKPINAAEYKASNMQKLDAFFQSNQDKNNYAKIYSYNAGPDGNAFYKRYAAYGQEKFDEVGFSPLRDNESNFNARTTRWDDFSRMMTHSFVPLFTRGFVSGPKSLGKMLTGDFTSADLEDARVYEEAAAMGQSNKGGIFGFANNAMMNFGYTAGIITEAIAEEAAGVLLAAPTGGSSLIASTANNLLKIPKLFKGLNAFKTGKRGYQAVKDTLRLTDKMVDARKFWQGAKETALGNFAVKAGQALNPLENTVDAVKRIRQADNITDLAILSKTAGGFYRDVRKINMALSEARLEAGMVENNVFDKLYNEAYKANDNQVPNDKELVEIEKQAKDASYETLIQNAALVYGSNAITFNNITSPKGGLRSFMKSTTDDIAEIAAREGQKNFGKLGKVVYDRAAKTFAIEKNNLKALAKGWLKNPIYKSAGKTIGYFKANFTEGIQENLQETIAEANEKYFIDSYKSPTLQSMLYSRATIRAINRGKLDYFSDSWEKQNPFTAQGAETFASGFFMGALAGPLNAAVPFLSSTYNRMFNKEQYEKWKTGQLKSAENLVKQLNDMSLKEFMGDNVQNLGAQDLLATVRNTGSKKEAIDSENEIFVTQVRTLRSSGTFGLFKEQLDDLKEMTDKEFADAVKIDESEVPKYRKRIDSSVERLDRIKDLYDRVERKNPNPVQKDIDLNDPDNLDQAFLKAAWDKNNENMVFFNEVYDNSLGRRAEIEEKYNLNPKYKSIDNRQRNLLFRPEDMADELDILNKELQAEKELGTNPNKVKQLEDKIKITKDYQENYFIFDAFFNRGNYAEVIGEEYKKDFGKEASPEELVEYMDQKLGSLDNENIKIGILQKLKDSHKNYLKTLAQQKGDYVFDADTDETFELLANYYKLGHEVKQITKYIEVLNDPDAFLDVVRRNMAWMKNQHAQRVKYFEDVVTSEMDKVRNNAFLNELANRGYYMSREDMDSYFSDGIAPEEIFNNITKEVYPKGSEKYKEIYQEFFEKREELKSQLNPRKTGIVDSAYQAEIDKLNAEKEDKINKLPKTETRVELGDVSKKGKNKTFSITELVDQLNPNEYVEVKVKGADQTLFPQIYFMDENGDLHFDNAEGDFVEISSVKDRYTEGKRFTLEMRPDPLEVEKIETEYKQLIDEVEERYAEAKSNIELEIPFEDVTPNSNLSTPDLQEFRKQLYQIYRDTFIENLPEEAQNELANDSELDNKTFEQWYAMPENKKYFDAYNKKNRPEVSNAEVVITYKGLDIDTKTKSLEQLVKYRDQINNDVTRYNETIKATPKDQVESIKKSKEELKELKKTLKAINNVVALRQFNKFPKSVQESVKGIQKVIDQQKGVVADSMVTEFDPVTGLKPGQRSYKINGDFYRRVTNAMQDVLGKKYTYRGEQVVINAFEQTIGKLGLNDKSIDSFLSLIKANLDSDPESLPGTNDILLFSNDKNPNNLEDTLKSLSGLSPEQIKIEREKQAVLDKIENLNTKIYDIEDSEEVNESKLNTYRDQREELYKKVIEIESRLRGATAPVSEEVTINDISNTQSNINDVQTLDGKYWVPKKVFEEAYKNDTGNRGQQTLDSIISRGGYSVKELDKLLPNWKELTVELNRGKAAPTNTDLEDSATKNNTTKDIITQFFRENTYQDGRDAGNFFDLAKDYLETGLAPAFDEEVITREAYDNLFNETSGYLTDIKRRVDAGEFYLVGRDIVVWKEIIKPDGTLDRIAGEIDIVLANENGIFVVDIKSGEESKFLNFNSLSTAKELYSKRNDYTLQTAIYATMLEDMMDKRVAGIAMLPIQRTSNKNTNQVVSAGKPTARTMYNKVVYKYDDKGNPVLNKFGEKQFEQTRLPFEIDFLVPLDRNSVKNELEQLLPRSATQLQPGSKSAAEKKFRIFKNNLETITNENSPKNRKRLADLEKLVEDFSKENNIPIPQDLKDALDAKSTTFRAYRNKEVLDSIINKYNKISKNSATTLEEKTKELGETKAEMSFDNIDLSDKSPFVLAQLASDDDVFIEYFKKHEKFKLSTSKPSVGQMNAIQAMITSGLVEPIEVDDILTMAEASEIIHDGVIRIQYLKVNSKTNAEARKLSEYQRTIFSLLSLTKSVQSNKAVADVLSNALEDANNGNIAEAVKNVDLEILSTKNQIDSKFTTDYQKKNLNDRLEDLENFKDALASTYAFAPSEVGPEILDQKVEEDEGVSILFEIPTVKPKFSIGDKVYSKKRNNNKEYTIVNVTEKNVMIVDENNKKSTVKIDTFGNNYYTSQEMNTGKPDAGYELQDTEQNIINQSQKTVDDFIQDSAALDKAKAEADKAKQSDIEDDLLNQIKNCQ